MRSATALYLAFLAAALVFYRPAQATDLNYLIPVETLWVEAAEGGICVAGKSVSGSGADWEAALENLANSASGEVFLETVERIVIAEEAADHLPALVEDPRLRPSVQLYLLRGEATEKLEDFTKAHPSEVTLNRPGILPVIREEEGSYELG